MGFCTPESLSYTFSSECFRLKYNDRSEVSVMYLDDYKRWMDTELEDPALTEELKGIAGKDDEIKDRFAVALKFGTAGLRGVLGAGSNRMNIYVVRQATQGLANWVKTQGGSQLVAISYDSRINSEVFAKTAASVLAANGIKVRIYDALMPVPALSFATRYYQANAGIMVTASHNPAKYNGYKAYGPDGCQMTDDAAAIVYDEIQKTDVLTGAKYMSFAEGVEEGLIRFVGDDCKDALYEAIESRQVRPGLCKTAGLKLVYSPLNGSGLVPVTQVLKDIGITDITIVPEQEYPNGYFTTCSYPNPEIFAALELGLNLAKETGNIQFSSPHTDIHDPLRYLSILRIFQHSRNQLSIPATTDSKFSSYPSYFNSRASFSPRLNTPRIDFASIKIFPFDTISISNGHFTAALTSFLAASISLILIILFSVVIFGNLPSLMSFLSSHL